MSEHTPMDRITNRVELMTHLRDEHSTTTAYGAFLAQNTDQELVRTHTTLHAKEAVEAAQQRAKPTPVTGYVVWTSQGVFGVFHNAEVAHAWMTDNHRNSDVYEIRTPEVPELFLVKEAKEI